MRVVLLTPTLAIVIACAAVPVNRAGNSSEIEQRELESLHDLVMLATTASLSEIEAFFGPAPEGEGPIRTKLGPFQTGRSALIEKVNYYRSGNGWDINFVLLDPSVAGCFRMDDLPELTGAREYFPLDSEPRTFRLMREDARVTFDSFPGRFSYNCLRSVAVRARSR